MKAFYDTVTLSEPECFMTIAEAAERGIAGGRIYDALILRCAMKAKAKAIYTLNLKDFRQVAPPDIIPRLRTP